MLPVGLDQLDYLPTEKWQCQIVVRTVHKAEIIPLYEGACEKSTHTKENGLPSTRTLWNILQKLSS